jgi:predicted lactoylglutathione lyase
MTVGTIPARLNVVTLGAHDLRRLRHFYSALGWEVAIEAKDFCAFRLGEIYLALFPWDKLASDGHAQPTAQVDGMRGFSLGINVDRPEQVDEIIAAVESAGAVITKPPGDPIEFEGRNAYFADPEQNYWEVVYLKDGVTGIEPPPT